MQLTRSQLKHDSRHVQRAADILLAHMARYGYEPVETPIIDSADLFLTSAGDQIISRLFTFERHGQQLALRPEFTAQAARRYTEALAHESGIARWQFRGPIFEDDPHDLARHYQRYSVGAELIGLAGAQADAEVISMAAHGLSLLGLAGWRLIVGHVGLMRHLLQRYGLHRRTERFLLNQRADLIHAQERILASAGRQLPQTPDEMRLPLEAEIDGRQATGARSRQDIMRRLAEKRQRAAEPEQVAGAVEFLQRWGAIQGEMDAALGLVAETISDDDLHGAALLHEWRKVLVFLDAYEIPTEAISLQPDLTRAWDYYTGIVFELQTADGVQVAGGGRYDDLIRMIGSKQAEAPAVGFAYYFDRLLGVLPLEAATGTRRLTLITRSPFEGARWAHRLRQHNISAVLTPADDKGSEADNIVIDADGTARFRQKNYIAQQLDDLIADLGWEHHER